MPLNFSTLPSNLIFPVKINAKFPLTKHGFKDASSERAQIEQWERQFPKCNWGMPTGAVSGIVVLDLDTKTPGANGVDWWADQQDIHGAVNTMEIETPSSGVHLYFQMLEGGKLASSAGVIAPGVDTRGNGGYVVIPPSCIDSNEYEIVNPGVPIMPLPDWLLGIWPREGEKKPRATMPGSGAISPIEGAIIAEGGRNDGLTSVAGRLWNQCPDVGELVNRLADYNQRWCVPPLDVDEVIAIAYSVSRYDQSGATDQSLSYDEIRAMLGQGIPSGFSESGGRTTPVDRFSRETWPEVFKYAERLQTIMLEHLDTIGDWENYERLGNCGNYRVARCGDCSTSEAHPFHCRYRLCSKCRVWQVKQTLDLKLSAASKLDSPEIYRINLGGFTLNPQSLDLVSDVANTRRRVTKALKKLTDNNPDSYIATDCLYGLRQSLFDGVLTLELVIMGENDSRNLGILQAHFDREFDRTVTIKAVGCLGAADGLEKLACLLGVPFVAETARDMELMMLGGKGAKLVQGKGCFYRQTMQTTDVESGLVSKSPDELKKQVPIPKGKCCGWCGSQNIEWQPGFYAGAVVSEVSPTTGLRVLRVGVAAKEYVAMTNTKRNDLPKTLSRLRKGSQWLTDAHKAWAEGSPEAQADERFSVCLAEWDNLERTLHQCAGYEHCIYGVGKRCPDEAPLSCDPCIGVGR